MISTKAKMPRIVLNIPIFLDFVHPENAMSAQSESKPNINAIPTIVLGVLMAVASTLKG